MSASEDFPLRPELCQHLPAFIQLVAGLFESNAEAALAAMPEPTTLNTYMQVQTHLYSYGRPLGLSYLCRYMPDETGAVKTLMLDVLVGEYPMICLSVNASGVHVEGQGFTLSQTITLCDVDADMEALFQGHPYLIQSALYRVFQAFPAGDQGPVSLVQQTLLSELNFTPLEKLELLGDVRNNLPLSLRLLDALYGTPRELDSSLVSMWQMTELMATKTPTFSDLQELLNNAQDGRLDYRLVLSDSGTLTGLTFTFQLTPKMEVILYQYDDVVTVDLGLALFAPTGAMMDLQYLQTMFAEHDATTMTNALAALTRLLDVLTPYLINADVKALRGRVRRVLAAPLTPLEA